MDACSLVNPGPVLHLHLQKSAANADSVLIQFSSPRLGSVFRYSVNVTCSPDNFTWVRFIMLKMLDAYIYYGSVFLILL